tara:strand:+ start:3249 stop:4004 length:756 start_codon:yes stop_codon:yes gene_type:complete
MTDYTPYEKALMEGGHEVPARKQEQYGFINGLGEARMFKTRQQIASAGADSMTDHLFVSLMSLYMMSNDYEYAPVAKSYAGQTIRRGNFNSPSPSGSDVYQTMHTLLKPEGLINSEKDKLLMNKVRIDQMRIKRFLRQIEQGNVPAGQAQQFFYKLEKDLAIQDPKLRATRRLVQNWNDLSTQQQQLAATQIDKYYRIQGMRSDMRPIFTKYAKGNGLIAGASRMGNIAKTVARKAGAFAIGYAAGRAAGV